MKIFLWILSIVLCATLYRMGGYGKPFNKLYRRIGIPIVCGVTVYFLLGVHNWLAHIICFVLLYASLTTYHDYVGFDNHWLHGFFIGLAYVPFGFDGEWITWGVRCLVLAVSMGAWSVIFGNDWVEELGRGAFIPTSLLIILF